MLFLEDSAATVFVFRAENRVASSFHCCSHHLRSHSLCSLLHEIANHSFDQRREASLNATGSYMF